MSVSVTAHRIVLLSSAKIFTLLHGLPVKLLIRANLQSWRWTETRSCTEMGAETNGLKFCTP